MGTTPRERRRMMAQAVLFIVLIAALSSLALAQSVPMPQGIMGTVYELDGITQVPAGTAFSVNNTVNGFFYQGVTGRGSSTGAYAVALTGASGNRIAIRAWNRDHATERNVSLGGVMKNVNLLLNMSLSNTAPHITSSPIAQATEDAPYAYGVTATDAEGDTLAFSLVTAPAGMSINATSGSISWLPTNDDVGQHAVSVRVSDGELNGTQGFTLTVENVNDAPAITSQPVLFATEDSAYAYQAAAQDVDAGDVLLYTLQKAPAGMSINSSSGRIAWLPGDSDVGEHAVTLRASDGELADTQSFVLTVENVNDAPVIYSLAPADAVEDLLYQYQVDASDVDNETLAYALVSAPAGMTLSSGGLVGWFPGNDDVGLHNVTLEVSDGIAVARQSYLLTVENVNDAPYITTLADTSATEDELYTYDVDASDIDTPQAGLSFSLVDAPAGMTISSSTGVISWLPGNADVGLHNVTVRVSDGELADDQAYALLVENVNDAPAITSAAALTALEDEQYLYQVLAEDIDGDGLTYALLAAPEGMAIVTVNSTPGVVMWLPDNDDVGSHEIIIEVSDGALSANQSYLLEVLNTNDAPAIISQPPTEVRAGELYTYAVSAADPDNDTLSFSLEKAPSGMALAGNVARWQPSAADKGDHQVIIAASDGNLTARQTYVLTVLASPAASGGGGGAPGTLPGKTTFLVEVFTGKAGALISVNASVTSTKDKGAAALLEGRALKARPDGIPLSPDMPVYQYLEISVRPLGNEPMASGMAEIVFAVEKGWLETLGAAPADVVLAHWDGSAWQPLDTLIFGDRADSYVFRSRSPSLSVFAITLSRGTALAPEKVLGEVEELAAPEESYSIGGIIYSANGSQVWRGAAFLLENLENGEAIEGTTGIAGDSGRFSAQVHAGRGDTLRLSVEGKEHLWFVVARDRDSLEMRTLLPAKKPRSGLLTGFATYLTHRAELSRWSLLGNALLVLLVAFGVLLARRMMSRQRQERA